MTDNNLNLFTRMHGRINNGYVENIKVPVYYLDSFLLLCVSLMSICRRMRKKEKCNEKVKQYKNASHFL